MTSQRHRFFRFLFIPLLILAVLLGLVLFRQHAGLPTRFSTQSNTPWNLILVNNEHALPRGYSPELTTLSNGVQVDSRIYPDLQSMFDDMRTEGVYPVVGEGYRSEQQQQEMMQEKIDAYLAEGYSERKARKSGWQSQTTASISWDWHWTSTPTRAGATTTPFISGCHKTPIATALFCGIRRAKRTLPALTMNRGTIAMWEKRQHRKSSRKMFAWRNT